MGNSVIQKEELLNKLTEIHSELEQLEKALSVRLSKERNKLMIFQTERVRRGGIKLSRLESLYNSSEQLNIKRKRVDIPGKNNIRLKLGF